MAKAAKKPAVPATPAATGEIMPISLAVLSLSHLNVRKTRPTEIAELAESIAAHGLLQNLVVVPAIDNPERFEVVAGGRRLSALYKLEEDQRIEANHQVPCQIVTADEAVALSLAENKHREVMHPVDEALAFAELVARKYKKPEIALLFGVSKRYVEQRLKIASLPPQLTIACQQGVLPLDLLQAFTVIDDLPLQLQVWDQIKDDIEEYGSDDIRDLLTSETIAEDDNLVKFIGIDAYKAAGGTFLQDLFTESEEAPLLTDVALVHKLAEKKLRKHAKAVEAEGWKWVGVATRPGYGTHRRLEEVSLPKSAELAAEYAALEKESDEINAGETITDEQDERLSVIEKRITEIEDQCEGFDPQEIALAGAVVTLHAWKPEVRVIRGYVRDAEVDALDKLQAERAAAIEAAEVTTSPPVTIDPPVPGRTQEDYEPLQSAEKERIAGRARYAALRAATRARAFAMRDLIVKEFGEQPPNTLAKLLEMVDGLIGQDD